MSGMPERAECPICGEHHEVTGELAGVKVASCPTLDQATVVADNRASDPSERAMTVTRLGQTFSTRDWPRG